MKKRTNVGVLWVFFQKKRTNLGLMCGTNGIFEANKRFNGHLWDA